MFRSESLSEVFFFSEEESQHFSLVDEEESFCFTIDGFLSIERDH